MQAKTGNGSGAQRAVDKQIEGYSKILKFLDTHLKRAPVTVPGG